MVEPAKARGDIGSNAAVMAWVIYGVLCLAGFWLAGSVGGLIVMAIAVSGQRRRRAVKIMDCTSLGYFAAAMIMAASPLITVLREYHVLIVWGVFAVVAWVTLAVGFPFTIQYARERAPREAWDTPLFRRINVTMTIVWALIFTLGAAMGVAALIAGHAFVLGVVIPAIAMGVGFIFNNLYPKRFTSRFETAAGTVPGATQQPAD
jgi:cobalamin synthase